MITQILSKSKDGGKDSPVDGYFLIEIKSLFSVALLKFNEGCREDYHTHAFDALTWFLCGSLVEEDISGCMKEYKKSWIPKVTKRNKCHRVIARKDSWCLTVRGRWVDSWYEINKLKTQKTVFGFGRKVISKINL